MVRLSVFTVSMSAAILLTAIQNLNAQWVGTNPAYYSYVSCFAVLDSTVLAGNGDGSLFRSTDLGSSWTNVSPLGFGPAIASLGVSGNVVFKGHGSFIFLSTDDGSSWQKSLSLGGAERTVPQTFALAASDSDLYAGVNLTDGIGRVYRSSDVGATWNDESDGMNFGKTFALVGVPTGSNHVIVAGTDRGIFRSTNNGATWDSANQGLAEPSVTCLTVVGQLLLAGTHIGISRSSDYGSTWETVPSSLSGHEVSSFAVCGTDIFAGTWDEGIFRSGDGGTTWSGVSDGLPGSCVTALTTAGNNILSGFVDGSIFRSTDQGGSWNLVCPGEKSADGSGWVRTCGNAVFAGGAGNLYELSHDGKDWIPILEGSRVLSVNDSAIYVTSDSGVSVSLNRGESWSTPQNTDFPWEPWIGLASFGSNLVLATYPPSGLDTNAGIFVSRDNGTTWSATVIKSRLILFVSSYENSIYTSVAGTLESSEDTGRTWHSYTFPSPPPPASYPGAFAIAFKGSELLVASSAGLLRSANSGKQWQYTASGMPGALYSIVVHGNDVFATTDSTVYHLSGDETSWTAVSGAFPSEGGFYASVATDDSYLYASFGSTVWKRPLSEMVDAVPLSHPGTPQQVSLSQNYPNPFNPSTTITFSLDRKSDVSLKVFNVLGQEVATMVNGTMGAGVQSVRFDAGNLSSGVYFYRLKANGQVLTRAMALTK